MRTGFSLVELSIVLVILGLLTGGILAGQSLIRAAELRSATTEFNHYKTALRTFQDKYIAIPGDMRNATDFWGAAQTGGGCDTDAGTGTQTCNGNGDGNVLRTASVAEDYNEQFTFWQHLANAGLLEGTYTGRSGTLNANHRVIGENVPSSKISKAGWQTVTFDYSNYTTVFSRDYGGHFALHGQIFGASDPNDNGVITPTEAWGIDTKLDDGKPGTGKVIAPNINTDCTDASAHDDFDANYALEENNLVCGISFIRVY